MECRFKFPIDLRESSSLIFENGVWNFIPKRNDTLLQRHNPFITRVWRGNTDFSAITSKNAVLNYISKYASKGENASEAYSDVLRRFISSHENEDPAVTVIRQLLISSVAERNYSAQEIMHLIMGWPLFHASRTIVVLSIREDWHRFGQARHQLLSCYPNRPENLDALTLYRFAKFYRSTGGRLVRRSKECIVRVVPHLKQSDDPDANEQFFKYQCKLHIPWRGNFEDILSRSGSWRDLYLRHLDQIEAQERVEIEFPEDPDDIQFEPEPLNDSHIVRGPAFALSRFQPVAQQRDGLGRRIIDEAFAWNDVHSLSLSYESVITFLRTYRTGHTVSRDIGGVITFDNMSSGQRTVMQ